MTSPMLSTFPTTELHPPVLHGVFKYVELFPWSQFQENRAAVSTNVLISWQL